MDRNRNNNREPEEDYWQWLGTAAKVAGAVAAATGIYYMATSSKKQTEEQEQKVTQERVTCEGPSTDTWSMLDVFNSSFSFLSDEQKMEEGVVSKSDVPVSPSIRNVNALLADVYVRHVALKDEDFSLHYNVFTEVLLKIHRGMKAVDAYYSRYSSNIQFAGSHYDRLKIKKPDEFDVDIVIGLPVSMGVNPNNECDLVIEQKYPGYIQLRGGVQYRNIPFRDGADAQINKAAYTWMDDRGYIRRSKFTDWFKSVGYRALNTFETRNGYPCVYVDDVCYTIYTSSSGPAWTLILTAPGFRLDVDLVPSLRFPESRWPVGNDYRNIPFECRRDYWMVVPKPNKSGQNTHDENRSWRIALQDQEKQLLYKTERMRTVIALMKYFRDTQGMTKIASYYIKTIFFWEIMELRNTDANFWHNDLRTCFTHMVNKFYKALLEGKIPYFWNKKLNLIGNINENLLNDYRRRTLSLLNALNDPNNYRAVAKCLLPPYEYDCYEIYYFY